MKNKVKKSIALFALCGLFAVGSTGVKSGDFWVGTSYLAAKNGASAEAGLAIGLTGLFHSALWGAALGGPAGAAAGIGYGL